MKAMLTIKRILRIAVVMLLGAILLTRDSLPPAHPIERVRAYTRFSEFDYVSWTARALGVKFSQSALGLTEYMPPDYQADINIQYLKLVNDIFGLEARLRDIIADPNLTDREAAAEEVRYQLAQLYYFRDRVAPIAEAVIQKQVTTVLADSGLGLGGQPVPPVLYHSTPLPKALIISPRTVIRQEANVSLLPDITIDQQVALESQVETGLDVSALVVGIGGVGLYPTMVMQTSDINWLAEVVAHEWVHNYLTLRPLGMSYLVSPELRTMNETAAAIAGKEIGSAVIARYYPDYMPAPPPPPQPAPAAPQETPQPPAFNFQAEMRETRVTVDALLADGKVEEAEAYMEERRRFLWDNGYHIRRLNQAYFAFYGAYADVPGGAAGEDPVGAAVRELRAQSTSLAEFLNTISWMSSFKQLQDAVYKSE